MNKRTENATLFVIRHPDGVACLHFQGTWRDAAEQIRKALAPAPDAYVDTVALMQNFAGLIEDDESEEPEE